MSAVDSDFRPFCGCVLTKEQSDSEPLKGGRADSGDGVPAAAKQAAPLPSAATMSQVPPTSVRSSVEATAEVAAAKAAREAVTEAATHRAADLAIVEQLNAFRAANAADAAEAASAASAAEGLYRRLEATRHPTTTEEVQSC